MSDVIKYKSVSYLGQRALIREIRTAGPAGEREELTHWLDDAKGQPVEYPAGTTTSRTVTGPRRNLTVLVAEHVVDVSEFYKSA